MDRSRQPIGDRSVAEDLQRGDGPGLAGPAIRGYLAVPLLDRTGQNIGLIQASDKFEGDFTEQDEAILVQLASIAANSFENARLYGSLKEQDRVRVRESYLRLWPRGDFDKLRGRCGTVVRIDAIIRCVGSEMSVES